MSNLSDCHENWRGPAWGCFWYTMKKQAPSWSQFWAIQVFRSTKILQIWIKISPYGMVHWMCRPGSYGNTIWKKIIWTRPVLSQVTHLAACFNWHSGSRCQISWLLNMTHRLGPLDVSWPGTYGNTIQNIHLIKTNPVTDHPPCFLSELTFRFWMSLWAGFQICPIVMK